MQLLSSLGTVSQPLGNFTTATHAESSKVLRRLRSIASARQSRILHRTKSPCYRQRAAGNFARDIKYDILVTRLFLPAVDLAAAGHVFLRPPLTPFLSISLVLAVYFEIDAIVEMEIVSSEGKARGTRAEHAARLFTVHDAAVG